MTRVEIEVLRLLGKGHTRREIAKEMGFSDSTIRRVIRRLCQYYGCTQTELPGVTGKENNGR